VGVNVVSQADAPMSFQCLTSPSNQATKPSLIIPARESDALALQRFRTAPGSIVAAGLELARLSLGSVDSRSCHEGLVNFLTAVTVVAVRAFTSAISDGLELIGNMTMKLKILVPGSPPARYVGRRHCVPAVRARSGLGALGAGSDYDVGEDAEEQVGMDAAGVCGKSVQCERLIAQRSIYHACRSATVALKEELTYKSTINGIVP